MFCQACGTEAVSGADFCSKCGRKLGAPRKSFARKAIILSLCLIVPILLLVIFVELFSLGGLLDQFDEADRPTSQIPPIARDAGDPTITVVRSMDKNVGAPATMDRDILFSEESVGGGDISTDPVPAKP